MSRLDTFLSLPNVADEKQDIFVNERLGNITIKPMTQDQYKIYMTRCKSRNGNKRDSEFDSAKFNTLVVIGQVVDPDFSNADFLQKAGFATPSDFINAKILPGEIAEIANQIITLSGFDLDIDLRVEEAKN